jgi:hypothetical protein
VARTGTVLDPGTVLTLYRIEQGGGVHSQAGFYKAIFEAGGRQYCCPLYRFQSHTGTCGRQRIVEAPALEALAV